MHVMLKVKKINPVIFILAGFFVFLFCNKLNTMTKIQEIWKSIEGYEGLYEVSNLGNIKSLPKQHGQVKYSIPFIIKHQVQRGYSHAKLSKDKSLKGFSVHRLVAIAFIPNPENKPQVNHKDGNKLNNHVDNLEWATSSENHKHAFAIGIKDHKGEKHSQSKLTDSKVLEIREIYESNNFTQQSIADKYGVSRRTIGFIVKRQRWAHI